MRHKKILIAGTLALVAGLITPATSARASATANTWVVLNNGGSYGSPMLASSASFIGTRATLAGDVSGDGKTDLVAVNDTGTSVMVSTSGPTTASFTAPAVWSSVPFYGSKATLLADVNGDGKADLVAVNDSSTWVMYSTGSAFGPPMLASTTPFFGAKVTLLSDVTNDLKADLVAVNATSTWVMESTSSGTIASFAPPALWSTTPFYGTKATLVSRGFGAVPSNAGLVAVDDTATWVMVQSGKSFGVPELWSSVPFYGSRLTALGGGGGLVAVNDSSIWVMHNQSPMHSYSSPTLFSSTPFFGTRATLLGDVNNDGTTDAIAVNG